jgi:formate dehydrogenase major subunit/formate dehydrogenase alpha subunit
VVGLATATGSGAMTNPISDIENCSVIMLVGSNPTANHPIVGYRIRRAKKKGAKLIVVDPRRIPLAEIADVHLQLKPGTDVALLNGLMQVILQEGLEDQDYIARRTNGFENMKEFIITRYPLADVAETTGVPEADIVRAARIFATAPSAAIFYCMGVTQHTCGTENVLAVTNLALVTGNIGKPNAGVNPLRGQNNVQGACDMGCLPHVLPGYQPLHSDGITYWQRLRGEAAKCEENGETNHVTALEFDFAGKSPRAVPADQVSDVIREKFSKAWGVELSEIPGRTINDMFHPNPSRWCRAMYIMGENPLISSPDRQQVQKALESLDFLVVQDIFLTETAQLADVVLPAASFAEQEGTFINTERRVQRVRRGIIPVGQSKPDWEIIQQLAEKLNLPWKHQSPQEIWDEVRQLTPHYFGGMSYQRLEVQGLQWPCPNEEHPGTPIMHRKSWCGEEDRFARGIGQFATVDYRHNALERPDEDYPFTLTTVRKLYQYHTRSMTGRVQGLNDILGEERMGINPRDAEKLGVCTGDLVRVTSPRGSITTLVETTKEVPVGVVSMSFHFAESAANVLTSPAVCSMSVASALKGCSVRIEKIQQVGEAG